MFAAFLGYNPIATLLPAQVTAALPAASRAVLLGQQFFPNLISGPFRDGLVVAFSISTALSVIAVPVSLMRGARVLYQPEESTPAAPADGQPGAAERLRGRKARHGYD
jgi:hypothetical protein